MPHLVIMRHGQSEANLASRIAGTTETPLTDTGKEQARQMGRLIKELTIEAAYCSTLGRARQTWVEVALELGLELEPVSSPRLREINWGVLNGQPLSQEKILMDEHPDWFGWEGSTPGGESYSDAFMRVTSYFRESVLPNLLAGKNTLLIGHGGMLKTLQGYLEAIPFEGYPDLNLRNCAVKIYHFDESGEVVSIETRCLPGEESIYEPLASLRAVSSL